MPSRRPALLVLAAVGALNAALSCGCGGEKASTCPPGPTCTMPPAAVTVSMDFTSTSDFYAAPFPTDARNGGAGVADFPNPSANYLAADILAILESDAGGFGLTSGIFFELTGALDTKTFPTAVESVAAGSPIVLIGIDPSSPDYLKQYPVTSNFLADGGPYGTANLLAVLPLQGVPLRAKTRYAVAVMDSLGTLAASSSMNMLASGKQPPGLGDVGFATYQAALKALAAAKIDVTKVVGLAAFTTGSPEDALQKVITAMKVSPPVVSAPFVLTDTFPTFCVYQTTIPMPQYQQGTTPYTYTSSGGNWAFDASGNPVLQRMEEANYYVTIPRSAMPAAGYPVVVFSRTGAGGNRPLVDRGVQGTTGGPPLVPGTGPALYFANVGYAGSEIDGPLGGLRNLTNGNEDFLIFNVGNPAALRDNIRQSAAELALQAHILDHVTVDVTTCPGATAPGNMATFDVTNMVLMSHSMGSTISPLALAYEPRFKAGLLSGSGGSWIENVIYKEQPTALLGDAEVLVGVDGTGYDLTIYDPLLSMFQWSCEAADPPVYSHRITWDAEDGPPRNILMMQGIVDHYIMPPIADAESLSLGLDLAGPELDNTPPEIAGLAPVGPLLPLVGRSAIALPASANVSASQGTQTGVKITAILTQSPSDGIEDGHEVVFQTDPPKHQYGCFLKSLLTGTPSVPGPGAALDPVPVSSGGGDPQTPGADRYRRYREALRGEPLPVAAVDLDAFERNVDALVAPVRARKKTLRVASKSVRCVDLLRRIAARGGDAVRGVMAFSPAEACFLAEEGFADVLVAYPTAQQHDVRLVAAAIAKGATIALAVDAVEHVAVASAAAAEVGVRLPLVVDVDVSYRPFGERVHVGVRRSPLRDPAAVAELVARIGADPHLAFGGLQAYEAHLAGIPDVDARAPLMAGAKRAMKGMARGPVRAQRRAILDELARRGIAVPLFNGGGTGSAAWSAEDPTLTEVAAGSGFVDSHLFDGFHGLTLQPAAFFALQVTRLPAPGLCTCQGGGFIASGAAGPDRLPVPYLPEGLSLLGLEGAGEVQTPLSIPPGLRLAIGDPVFFRHAKAGELAEHFATYALIRGDRIEARVPTYRGAGHSFH